MQQLSEQLQQLRVFLEGVHPAVPAILMLVGIFGSQWAVRKFIPGVWEWCANLPFPGGAHKAPLALFRKAWQALPSAAIGAFLTALAYPGANITDMVLGAICALLAPVFHEVVKALPVPYTGATPSVRELPPIPRAPRSFRDPDKTPIEGTRRPQ